MEKQDWLAEQFESYRSHLQAVAFRLLGSLSEADDAVQETWLRLSHINIEDIDNLGGWLTTVTARVCLDLLRKRNALREDPLGDDTGESYLDREGGVNPEQQALLADAVGYALLVVLNTLNPAERIAFVLHDIFSLSFDEIAPIVGRSIPTTRQLASRARRRVKGAPAVPVTELGRQQEVVEAFLTAARAGNFAGLLGLLDPEVVMRADSNLVPWKELRGPDTVARFYAGRAQGARAILVDGKVGVVVAPGGELLLVMKVTVVDGKITRLDAISGKEELQKLDLAVLDY